MGGKLKDFLYSADIFSCRAFLDAQTYFIPRILEKARVRILEIFTKGKAVPQFSSSAHLGTSLPTPLLRATGRLAVVN